MRAPDRPAARADWEKRIGRRGVPGQDGHAGAWGSLPPPSAVRAVPGRGHVMLDWVLVPGRPATWSTGRPAEPYEVLDHGGGDVSRSRPRPTPKVGRAGPGQVLRGGGGRRRRVRRTAV